MMNLEDIYMVKFKNTTQVVMLFTGVPTFILFLLLTVGYNGIGTGTLIFAGAPALIVGGICVHANRMFKWYEYRGANTP